MTVLEAPQLDPPPSSDPDPESTPKGRFRRQRARPDPNAPLPPLSSRLRLARAVLVLVVIVAGSLLVQLLLVSGLQHRATQQQLFDGFRRQLAEGTAPVSPVDEEGRALPAGTAVAYLEIPSLGVDEVVVSGTASGVTFNGPGHRRDSPLPGVGGTSVILGRSSAFGAPFANLGRLEEGAVIRVTTGQGTFEFEVLGVRREGDPIPPLPEPGEARLLLMTADGGSFVPSGVLRVDAVATTPAVGGSGTLFSTDTLPPPEQAMAADTTTLWALVLWLEALIVGALGLIWAWHRWGRVKAWVVFLPILLVVGLATSREIARLLPNLL